MFLFKGFVELWADGFNWAGLRCNVKVELLKKLMGHWALFPFGQPFIHLELFDLICV